MTHMTKLLLSASGLSIAVLGVQPAFAAGTTAGSSITNTVTVEFQVGGVDQTDVTASDTFVVDRKINTSVAEQGNVTTTVAPNQQDAVTAFNVTNSSNDVVDINLAATNSAAAHGGTDNFDVSGFQIYLDDGDGSYDSGDTLITYLDEMAEDETRLVFVIADIPNGRATGDVAGIRLTGTVREGGAVSSLGAAITESSSNDAAVEDTVFADADGTFDGISFDNDDYTVAAAALSAVKISEVLATGYPIAGATEYFNIPGATVQYCIAVTNASGGADATGVTITDTVPADTTFVGGSILIGGSYDDNGTPGDTSDDSCSGGSAGGSFDGTDVTAPLGTVSAGTTEVVTFRATID